MATDWAALRVEYINGSMQYKELAATHGLKEGTVRQRGNREKWTDERNALSRAVTQAVTQKATEEKIDLLEKWNQSTIKEAEMLRIAARSLYMEKSLDGQMRIKAGLEPAQLNAAQSANLTADRLVRLATGSSTENSMVTTKELPSSVNEFI